MTQLVEESASSTVAGQMRVANFRRAGLRNWYDCFEQLEVDSEGAPLPSSSHIVLLTSASDPDMSDWISPNATGGWKVLVIPLTHKPISSFRENIDVLPFIQYEPFDIGIQSRNIGELSVAALAAVGRPTTRKTGALPIMLEDDQATSEALEQTWDSNLLSLLLEERLINYFGRLARGAEEEAFFDGVESVFSHWLTSAVGKYGDAAVLAIGRLLSLVEDDAEVSGEILRHLGSIEDPRTHRSRLTVLVDKLKSPDPRIRDAASLGLAALDDPEAIADIQEVLDRELSPQLRGNLKLVVDQLRSTRWQPS